MADDRENAPCTATFHHTTARGFCSKCGKAWEHRSRRVDVVADLDEQAMDAGWDPSW